MQMCSLPRWWSVITHMMWWSLVSADITVVPKAGPGSLSIVTRRTGGNVSPHHQQHLVSPHIKQVSFVRYQSVSRISRLVCILKSFELQGNCNIFWILSQCWAGAGKGCWSRRVKHPGSGQRPFIRLAGLTPSSHPCSPRVIQWGAHYKLSHNVFMLSK